MEFVSSRTERFRRPLSLSAVSNLMDAWLDQPTATLVHPGPHHLQILRELLLPIEAAEILRPMHIALLSP